TPIARVRPEPRLRSLAGTPSPRSASSQLAHLRSLATSQHSFVAEPKSFKDRRIREPGAGVSGAPAKGASASGRRQLNYQARSGGPRGPREGRVGQRPTPTKQSGEYRARNGDLLVANQAISQLS